MQKTYSLNPLSSQQIHQKSSLFPLKDWMNITWPFRSGWLLVGMLINLGRRLCSARSSTLEATCGWTTSVQWINNEITCKIKAKVLHCTLIIYLVVDWYISLFCVNLLSKKSWAVKKLWNTWRRLKKRNDDVRERVLLLIMMTCCACRR